MLRYHILGVIGLSWFLVACATGSADLDFDIDTQTNDLTFTNFEACTIAINNGEGNTTSACEVSFTTTYTVEETSGDCDAKNVKLNYTFHYPDGDTLTGTVDFGTVSAGKTKSIDVTITHKNANLLGSTTTDGDVDYDSECASSLEI